MNTTGTANAADGTTSRVLSPVRLLASLLLVLFTAEALVMFTLPLYFHTSIDAVDNFADSVLLSLISAPFIWYLIARPLHATAMEIGRLNVSLSTRAVELEHQNAALQEAYRNLELETAARHRMMEELLEKDRLLIQQSRMAAMGEMLGYIAHQWRQPLNLLGVKVQELGLSYEYGDLSKELLDANIDMAMETLQHLSQTISVFQNFTATDKEKCRFSTDQVMDKTVQIIGESLRHGGITLDISSTGTPQIYGHPNEFCQVLVNLLLNAKDAFQEQGTPYPTITVRSWTENDRSVLTVTDNAGGIKEDILDKIFDAYFTTKDLGKGTGVGLFMSKVIIEKNMGGRITARNVEHGSEFRIEV